jgi:hypothetical protein
MTVVKARLVSDPVLVWLTGAALDRMGSSIDNDIIKHVTDPLPDEGLAVGMPRPLMGDIWFLRLLGRPDIDRFLTNLHRVSGSPTGLTEPDLTYRMVMAFNQKSEQVGNFGVEPSWGVHLSPVSQSSGQNLQARLGYGDRNWMLEHTVAEKMRDVLRVAWTLLNSPEETEVTATRVTETRVSAGKERRGNPRDREVSVIDIRPPSPVHRGSGGEPIEHDHRWIVRGHWRNQPWGKKRTLRRRIWIDEHVVGPKDKPLLNRPKVNVVR